MGEQHPLFAQVEGELDPMLEAIVEELLSQGISTDELDAKLEERIPGNLSRAGAGLLEGLKQTLQEVVDEQRSLRDRFTRRLRHKWGHPLRLMRMLLELVRDAGDEYNKEHRPAAVQENDIVFDALVRLHARACLIGEEVQWLLEGGFASGAQSRWRTLHELTTVAFFIEDNGQDVAERYLLHHVVESCKAAHQYQDHCKALGEQPLPEKDLEEHRKRRDELCQRYGAAYREEWGWAAGVLGRSRPTFADIERAVGRERFRPYVKFSCYPNHAGSKGLWYDLGNSLNADGVDMALSGPSDAGLAEPGITTALALFQITTGLLLHREPTLTTLVIVEALGQLSREVQEAFAQADANLAERAPKVRERLERFVARPKER